MRIAVRLALVAFVLCAGCEEPTADEPPPSSMRTFATGFTPFPYDISQGAVDFTYERVRTDADLVAHHFDDGVPWPEALARRPYDAALLAEWRTRRDRTPPGHKVYVAVTPIDIWRTNLAPYRGASGDTPLPAPWDFVMRDYDPLWEKIGRTDLALAWRDTGLYDEAGRARPAMEVWRRVLAEKRAVPSESEEPIMMAAEKAGTLTALKPLVGAWEMEVTFKGMEPMRGGARVSFEWMGEHFLVQRWEIPIPEAPNGIAMIGADPKRPGGYLQHYFDTRGVARVYKMSFANGVWKLWRDEPDFSPFDFEQRYTGTVGADGKRIDGRWEICNDGKTWEHDFDISYIRAG